MAIFAPRYVEFAAIEFDGSAALGEPPPVRGNERRAGACATCSGDPGASFPYAQPDSSGTADFRNTDICAFRKQRVMFECGPEHRESDGGDVINKKGRV